MFASDILNTKLPYAFGNELKVLRELAKDAEYSVMIGAGPGVMALALLESNPELNLLVIDIETCKYAKAHAEFVNLRAGYVVHDSSTYPYSGPQLDILIVDGDHSKEGVIRDTKHWYKYVKSGGILFFHDYVNINDDPNNGVKEAIDILLNYGTIDYTDNFKAGVSTIFRKK